MSIKNGDIFKQEITPEQDKIFVSYVLSLLCAVTVTYFSLIIISTIVHSTVDVGNIADIFVLSPQFFAPEPLERTLFISGIIVMPVSLFAFYLIFRNLSGTFPSSSFLHRTIYPLFSLSTVIIVSLLAWLGLKRDRGFYLRSTIGTESAILLFVVIVAISCYLLLTSSGSYRFLNIVSKLLQYSLLLISSILMLAVFLYCIYGEREVSETQVYTIHFNAVFHAVVQVYLGEELLVDLSHQYGLYPHFLEPVFRMIGLTVLNFTIVMGMLMVSAIFLIYQFLRKMTKNRIITSLGFITVMFYTYIFGKLITPGGPDSYFQYHPIRFIFPVLSIYLAYFYFLNKDKRVYYLSFITSSAAIFWNFDTGFIVFLSWLLTLFFCEAYVWDVKAMMVHILKGSAIFISVLFSFTSYMYIRYGHVPDYSNFLRYQQTFYYYGLGMLPMPGLLHPWNLVLLTYSVGLLYAIVFLIDKKETVTANMVFFLSILGTGLFSYYQGRSHDANLLNVWYPAILILIIFADRLLTAIKSTNRTNDKMIFIVLLFFMIFSTMSLLKVNTISRVYEAIASRLKATFSSGSTPVLRTADFVKQNTARGEKVLILSSLSAIYYLDSGTTCPLSIPGPIELARVDECRKIMNYLAEDGNRKAFIDVNFNYLNNNAFRDQFEALLNQRYSIIAVSTDGNMFLIGKKSASRG